MEEYGEIIPSFGRFPPTLPLDEVAEQMPPDTPRWLHGRIAHQSSPFPSLNPIEQPSPSFARWYQRERVFLGKMFGSVPELAVSF